MQVESKIRNIKGRTSYLNQRPRRTKSTCASSPFDSAKVVRSTETAKRNLEKLAEKYKGINNVEGFLNDLWLALGLQNQGGNKKGGKPSRYALYQLQDGTKLSISIRASAHNANANKYVEHPPVPDINLSIVLQKKMRKNQFKSNPSVNIGEYVYVNQKIQNVESPLSQIANSLIGFLSNGEYNDTTGVAIVHGNMQTPQEVVNNQTLNCNRNMNKKLIRLTESDLHRIVKESVNKALNKNNSVFYDDRPSKITKVDRSNSSNKHTMSPEEIEKIHNIVSEVSVAPNGFKHRFDPNKRDGDFPLEQPEWTKDPRWQGWNGEDPEWIMKQQEKYPYGGESKQSVRVSEAQLHQIVKESVEQVLSEGLFGNLFKSAGQREFERRRKEAQDAYSKFKREEEEYDKNHIDPRTISDDDMDRNDYKRIYGTTAGYSPDWRERRQREMQTQRRAYLNGRSHY